MEFDAFMKGFPCNMFPDIRGAVSDLEGRLRMLRGMCILPRLVVINFHCCQCDKFVTLWSFISSLRNRGW